MAEYFGIDIAVKEFLSQASIKPIIESLTSEEVKVLSGALADAFSRKTQSLLSAAPPPETFLAVLRALNTIADNVKDASLQTVIYELIEELSYCMKKNERRISDLELQVGHEKQKLDHVTKQLHQMTDELKRIKSDLNDSQQRMNRTECLFLANDLSELFLHYVFEPKCSALLGKPVTWSNFTDDVARSENNLKHEQLQRMLEKLPPLDDEQIEKHLNLPYESIQKRFSVDIRELRSLKRERATVAHSRIKSALEQQRLLEKAREVELPSEFEYKEVFYGMINALDKLGG